MTRVLLIDDDPSIHSWVDEELKACVQKVIHAPTGGSGIKLALNQKPDVILLDLELPDMSGIEVCREIRLQDQVTPILFLSATVTAHVVASALDHGANGYIGKPLKGIELRARVRALVRSSPVRINLSLDCLDDLSLVPFSAWASKVKRHTHLSFAAVHGMECLEERQGTASCDAVMAKLVRLAKVSGESVSCYLLAGNRLAITSDTEGFNMSQFAHELLSGFRLMVADSDALLLAIGIVEHEDAISIQRLSELAHRALDSAIASGCDCIVSSRLMDPLAN